MFQHPQNNFLDSALRNRYVDLDEFFPVYSSPEGILTTANFMLPYHLIKLCSIGDKTTAYILYAVKKNLASPCLLNELQVAWHAINFTGESPLNHSHQ
jgi:hypothetical protein